MIKIENISKNFASQELFKDLSFNINDGEKIGLIGRNGTGKSTILKMITGEIEPDKGTITIPKNYKIGYLEQHISFSMDNVLDEASLGLSEENKYDTWKAEKILFGLGFSEEDLKKDPKTFSGGYQLRINLAKVLLGEPNLLLLDEPNNYLDIVAIRWLEKFLKSWKGEIALITHDRSFMDNIITHTVCIHRKKAKKITGKTEKIYDLISQEEEIYEKTRINEEKKRKELENYIERFRAKATLGKSVQSKIKFLEKMEVKEKLEKLETLDISFNYTEFNADQMIKIENLKFSYDNQKNLIENLSFTIKKDDKIAIIGKNGKGKSTLLKLLIGILKPNSGQITTHPNMKLGYFGQTNLENLNLDNDILEELIEIDPNHSIQKCRNVAGNLMFSGDLANKKIRVLSGGERHRVMLGKILLSPCNILFLDEPTNHLDMDSNEALLKAINSFKGATVIVTHNENYLKNFAKKLIVFDNNKISVYDYTYQEFLDLVGWSEELEENSLNIKKKNLEKFDKNQKNLLKKEKAKLIQEKSKILKPINLKIENLEKEIENLDKKIIEINENFLKLSLKPKENSIKLKDLSIELKNTKNLLDEKYKSLDNLYLEKEKLETNFKEI